MDRAQWTDPLLKCVGQRAGLLRGAIIGQTVLVSKAMLRGNQVWCSQEYLELQMLGVLSQVCLLLPDLEAYFLFQSCLGSFMVLGSSRAPCSPLLPCTEGAEVCNWPLCVSLVK